MFAESNEAKRRVLRARMEDGCLPSRPLATDVRELSRENIPAGVDGVTAGVPCQSVSQAGRRLGMAGPSGLVREVWRVVDLTNACFVLLENVDGLRSHQEVWRSLLEALWARSFQIRWATVSGENVGVRQRRRRIFLLATRGPLARAGPFYFLPEDPALDTLIEREWDAAFNPPGRPPMHRWLSSAADVDQARLAMLGDAVIPQQALLAASLFATQ